MLTLKLRIGSKLESFEIVKNQTVTIFQSVVQASKVNCTHGEWVSLIIIYNKFEIVLVPRLQHSSSSQAGLFRETSFGDEIDTSRPSADSQQLEKRPPSSQNDLSVLEQLAEKNSFDDDDDDSNGSNGEIKEKETSGKRLANCCSMKTAKKRLPFFEWLPKTTFDTVVCDLVAGLSVGLTVIPHGFAFATLAGIPVQVTKYSLPDYRASLQINN